MYWQCVYRVTADESHTFSSSHVNGCPCQLSRPTALVTHRCHSLSHHWREAQTLKRAIWVWLCCESIFIQKPSSGRVPQSNNQLYKFLLYFLVYCWLGFGESMSSLKSFVLVGPLKRHSYGTLLCFYDNIFTQIFSRRCIKTIIQFLSTLIQQPLKGNDWNVLERATYTWLLVCSITRAAAAVSVDTKIWDEFDYLPADFKAILKSYPWIWFLVT